MRSLLMMALLALAAAPLSASEDPEPPGSAVGEVNALRGRWALTRSEVGTPGSTIPFPKVTALTFATKGVKWHEGKTTKELTFRLDMKKSPKHIDLIDKDGAKTLGIYKLEKGQLTLAVPVRGGDPRLTSFESDETILLVFKKQKK